MIGQKSMTHNRALVEWAFTVDTEGRGAGQKMAGVPLSLYGYSRVSVNVDWGDGTSEWLQPSMYTSSSSTASIHEYAEPGVYQIRLKSTDWGRLHPLTFPNYNSYSSYASSAKAIKPLYYFYPNLISVDSPIPKVAGVKYASYYSDTGLYTNSNSLYGIFSNCRNLQSIPADVFANNADIQYVSSAFARCSSLQSIPRGIFDSIPLAIGFNSCFAECTSIQSIPQDLFANNTAATAFNECFRGCTSLQSIPENLFSCNTASITFESCFRGCASLQSIPENLFSSNTASTTFDSCFYDCNSLQSIPPKLFSCNAAAITFASCFRGCASLDSIPSDLFSDNAAATTFNYCFYGCSSLQSIPENLFSGNPAATTFDYCFSSCTHLQSIPQALFSSSTAATSFYYCFANCSYLQSIPDGLFDSNTAVTTFNSCFQECSSLRYIPDGLFDSNTAVATFASCFYRCTSLQSIPENLFSECTEVTSFNSTFFGCSSLQTIPEDLFNSNAKAVSFNSCFYNCMSIREIPSSLFSSNINVTSFDSTFFGCKAIQFIPDDLFKNCTKATNFYQCFCSCTALQSIPASLFENNAAAESFSACFNGCTSIESIPSRLFAACIQAKNFYQCFLGATALKGFKLVIGSPNVTSFANFVSSSAAYSRILCIPANSTTASTLSSYASYYTIETSEAPCMDVLIFTVNASSVQKGAVPVFVQQGALLNEDSILYIDWGDGEASEINFNSDFQSELVHNYASAGTYQITAASRKWEDLVLAASSSQNQDNQVLDIFRTNLVSIDGPLPPVNWQDSALFAYCTELETVAEDTFSECHLRTDFSGLFKGCASLQAIPAAAFKDCQNAETADEMFEGCTSIQYVPSGIFAVNKSLRSADRMFKDCSSLSYVSEAMFLSCWDASRTDIFSGTQMPADVLKSRADLEEAGCFVELYDTRYSASGNNASVPLTLNGSTDSSLTLDIDWGDGTVSSLTPSDYPSGDNSASVHSYSDAGLYYVVAKSSSWIDTKFAVYNYRYSFKSISEETCNSFTRLAVVRAKTLVEAPAALPNVMLAVLTTPTATSWTSTSSTSLANLYAECRKLRRIYSGIFSKMNRQVSAVDGMFYTCSSLEAIPEGLFDFSSFESCTTAAYIFYSCIKIKSLPMKLFCRFSKITSLSYAFYYSSLNDIPYDLLAYSPKITNISYCFHQASNLNAGNRLIIASGLISNCTDCFPLSFNLETLCVPAESTTYSSMMSYKTSKPNSILNLSTIDFECSRILEITVDTEGAGAGERRASLPFIPEASCTVEIDWGDGTAVRLSASDLSDASKTMHEYAEPGVYPIVCSASNWSALRMLVSGESSSSANAVLFRSALKSIDSQLPRFANENLNQMFSGYTSLSAINGNMFLLWKDCTEAVSCFEGCSSLQEIPAGLLSNLSSLEDATRMFALTGIEYIPSGLFGSCVNLQDVTEAFDGCSSLGGVSEALFVVNSNLRTMDNAFRGTLNPNPSFKVKEDFEESNTYVELCDVANMAGIPFYVTSSGGSLTVDWGDGSINTLTKASIDSSNLAECRHQYSNPGMYYITVQSDNWSGISAIASDEAYIATETWNASCIYYRQNSLVKAITRLPAFSGIRLYYGASSVCSNASNSAARLYYSCSKLTEIPSNLFELLPNLTSFLRCFGGCTKLGEIPEGLFDAASAAEAFQYCFYGCKSVASIPDGLFDACGLASNFDSCFYNCSSIDSIPEGLFDHCPNVTSFASCFYGCTSLVSIPESLFAECPAVTSFTSCFYGCTKIASIPENLFAAFSAVATFNSCFYGCTSLASIPENLFSGCSAVTTFASCFYGCSAITIVSEGIFAGCSAVTSFASCFYGCTSLVSIPENLFAECPAVTSFASCFYNCTSLASIPESLFMGCPAVTTFASCFYGCSKIVNVPESLFIANVLVLSFAQCFRGCSKLATVPEMLFNANTEVTSFGGLFWSCGSLKSVPENLFISNTKVAADGFGALFTQSGLTSFPENLLVHTDKLTQMNYGSYGILESTSYLGDFSMRLISRNISNVNWFCTKKSGTTRIVYVPTGSTTETTFNSNAESLGLTIIGE